jgi:hypothetical protein
MHDGFPPLRTWTTERRLLAHTPEPGTGTTAGERQRIDCGDLEMRISADGSWFYRGSRIDRRPLVKLFASVLRREPDGSYWLVTPAERGRVQVDDAPFVAVEAALEGAGRGRAIRLRTNLDQWVEVGPDHPLRVASSPSGDARIYVSLGRGLEAALARPVWYELLDHALADSDEADGIGIWAGGCWFDLSALAGEEA